MNINRVQITNGYQTLGHSGAYTFGGVVQLLIEESIEGSPMAIDKGWQDSTRDTFKSNVNTLLRMIPATKTMASIRDSYLDDLLENARKLSGGQYAEATIQNLEYTFLRIYGAGIDRKLYKNRLELFDPEDSVRALSKTEYAGKLYRIKKSFTIEEEKRVLAALRGKPEEMTGEQIGLLICFLCAVRENEACGLDYKDIIDILDHTAHALMIYETSMINSSKRKASGKTKNADRIIPIFDFLYDFLERRIKFLQAKIDKGELQLSERYETVYDLPIVCIGHNYKKRCPTKNLTYSGRKFFKKLDIKGVKLSLLYRLIHEEEFSDYDIYEKEPTTYLFRRNRGTSLYYAGLSPDLIQYYMGQKIESRGITRNALTNDKYLAEIKKRMDMLPIAGIRDSSLSEFEAIGALAFENVYEERMMVRNINKSTVRIIIETNEPNDCPKLSIQGNGAYDIQLDERLISKKYSEMVNIVGRLNEAYRKGEVHGR